MLHRFTRNGACVREYTVEMVEVPETAASFVVRLLPAKGIFTDIASSSGAANHQETVNGDLPL
jgi:hypothetical protein